MMTESAFFNHSKNIVEDFLSTAIIFDDQANFGDYRPDQAKTLITPVTRNKIKQNDVDTDAKEAKTEGYDEVAYSSHDLNAKKVVNSFAKKGILCSIIKPEENELESLNKAATPLIKKADLIIFDWELSQSSDKTALSLIIEAIELFNNKSPKQLRLIAVYTGATDIDGIFSIIKASLSSDCEIKDQNERCCQIGSCRLLIFAKETAKTAEGIKKVSFEDLADFLVNEYTKMTKGVVSNVVMKSFSSIKNNTHQVLAKFSGLDYPFLTHRICLPNPQEAEDHIATLISEEIQSLLEEYNVGAKSNIEALKDYFDEKPESLAYSIKPLNSKKNDFLTKEHILLWLEKGISSNGVAHPNFLSNKEIKKIFQFFTEIMSGEEGENLDLNYAAVTTLRSKYSDGEPHLSLGTIIKELSGEGKYWICMQPGCDSVRLDEQTSFPFLPIIDEADEKDIHCIVPLDSNTFSRKKISIKFSNCRIVDFIPDSATKSIKAIKEGDEFVFEAVNNNEKEKVRFQYLCELKPIYAQRLSNKFAANISRVATNNSEWLRRCEEKNL